MRLRVGMDYANSKGNYYTAYTKDLDGVHDWKVTEKGDLIIINEEGLILLRIQEGNFRYIEYVGEDEDNQGN